MAPNYVRAQGVLPEVPTGPAGIKTSPREPITVVDWPAEGYTSSETECEESSRHQARRPRIRTAVRKSRQTGEQAKSAWHVWSQALNHIREQERVIFALQEGQIQEQRRRIKSLEHAAQRAREREGIQKRKRVEKENRRIRVFTQSTDQSTVQIPNSPPKPYEMGSQGTATVTPLNPPEHPAFPYPLMPMPPPGAPGAPCFRGKNVTQFLEVLENMYLDYRVTDEAAKCKKLAGYCEPQIARYVRAMEDYELKNWEALKASLLLEYEREDVDQQMQTRAFLEAYKNQKRGETHDLRGLCRYFTLVSNALVKRGELDEYTQSMYFLESLPEKVRSRTLRATKVDPKKPATMKYKELLKTVQAMAMNAETEALFKNSSGRQKGLSGLVQRVDSSRDTEEEYNLEPESAGIESKADLDMDKLVDQMQSMSMNINTVVNELRTNKAPGNTMAVPAAAPRLQDPAKDVPRPALSRTTGVKAGMGVGTGAEGVVCYYCDTPGHIKPRCQTLARHQISGFIHVNGQGRLAYGPSGIADGTEPEVVRETGKSMAQVVDEHMSTGRRAPAAIRYISVSMEDSGSEEEVRDEGDEPQCLADVFAARAVKPTGPTTRAKGKQVADGVTDERAKVTKGYAERERAYPTMKALRNGMYEEAVTGPSGLGASAPNEQKGEDQQVHSVYQDEREATLLSGRPAPPPKHPKTSMSKLLKGVSNPMILTEKIMATPIQLQLGELLANSKEMQHVWFGRIPDPTYQAPVAAQVRNLGAMAAEGAQGVVEHLDGMLYTAASPRVRASVEGKEMTCLLDSGAEVTVMSARLASELGLPISNDLVLNVAGVHGPLKRFVGVIEAVKVRVGSLEHQVPVWVMEQMEQDFILGRTYSRAARLTLEDRPDGSCQGSVRSADGGTRVSFQAVSATAAANRDRCAFSRQHSGYLNESASPLVGGVRRGDKAAQRRVTEQRRG